MFIVLATANVYIQVTAQTEGLL